MINFSEHLYIDQKWDFDHQFSFAITIRRGSFPKNQDYQFMVEMINRQNSSEHYVSYLIVHVQNLPLARVVIECVFSPIYVLASKALLRIDLRSN